MSPHEALDLDIERNLKLREAEIKAEGKGLVPGAPEKPIKTNMFPNEKTARRRRQIQREQTTANALMATMLFSAIYFFVAGGWTSLGIFLASFIGFFVLCFVAGSRVDIDSRFHNEDFYP